MSNSIAARIIDASPARADNIDLNQELMRYIRLVLSAALILLAILLLALWLQDKGDPEPIILERGAPSEPSQVASDPTMTLPDPAAVVPEISTAISEQSATSAPTVKSENAIEDPTKEPELTKSTSTVRVEAAAVTLTPTESPSTPTAVLPPAIVSVIDSVDRTCPDPSPARPEYYHYYLSGDIWATPDLAIGDHFWMTKPFEGGGRLLITEWFPYGYDAGGRYLIHNGIDMAEPKGTPLLAVADGTVHVAGDDASALYGWRCDWYGHLVVIELDDLWQGEPVYALYGHVQNIGVEVGQRVSRGQAIAEVGVGGAATRAHLHFEVRVGEHTFDGTRNPLLWIAPPSNRGLIVGRLVDPEGRPWQGVAISALGKSEGTSDYTSWTYLGDPELIVNPDETYAENFVIGDVAPGIYDLIVSIQGVLYKLEIDVEPSRLTTVEIVTEPFKTPTPEPPAEG